MIAVFILYLYKNVGIDILVVFFILMLLVLKFNQLPKHDSIIHVLTTIVDQGHHHSQSLVVRGPWGNPPSQ